MRALGTDNSWPTSVVTRSNTALGAASPATSVAIRRSAVCSSARPRRARGRGAPPRPRLLAAQPPRRALAGDQPLLGPAPLQDVTVQRLVGLLALRGHR